MGVEIREIGDLMYTSDGEHCEKGTNAEMQWGGAAKATACNSGTSCGGWFVFWLLYFWSGFLPVAWESQQKITQLLGFLSPTLTTWLDQSWPLQPSGEWVIKWNICFCLYLSFCNIFTLVNKLKIEMGLGRICRRIRMAGKSRMAFGRDWLTC